MHQFTIATWSISQADGDWYVAEKIADVPGTNVYGPMREAQVDPFIAERRAFFDTVANRMAREIHSQNSLTPNFGVSGEGLKLLK